MLHIGTGEPDYHRHGSHLTHACGSGEPFRQCNGQTVRYLAQHKSAALHRTTEEKSLFALRVNELQALNLALRIAYRQHQRAPMVEACAMRLDALACRVVVRE